jgi:hypothetical protein
MESLAGGELTLSNTRAFLSFQRDQQTKLNEKSSGQFLGLIVMSH